jgi:hypothetical protein
MKGTNRPTRDQRADGSGRQNGASQIVHHADTLCTTSAFLSHLPALWACDRADRPSPRLSTDALPIAIAVHALREQLADALEGEGR